MRLRDLPGYPATYIELAELGSRTRAGLRVRAFRAAEADVNRSELASAFARQAEEVGAGPNASRSLALLATPASVLVAAQVQPALFGGILAQALACLTAIRLAQDLGRDGCLAIPVICVDSGAPAATEVRVVDAEGGIVVLPSPLTADGTIRPDVGGLTEEFAKIYSLKQSNPESLKMLGEAYSPGLGLGLATRRFLAGLLEPWGALIASCPDPCLLRTVAVAFVIGPGTVARPSAEDSEGEPGLWPSVNATLVDSRSRKTMDRYALALPDLFAGKEALLDRVERELGEQQALERLGQASSGVDAGLAELEALVPAGDSLHKAIAEAQGKMNYQLEKVRERYAAAAAARRDIAARQLERLCNALAPAGRPQELELAAVHFVLRYSRTVLAEIVDRMDPYSSEHQQIALE